MKSKHIISSALIVVLPFIIIFGFGALSDYLNQLANHTFLFGYRISPFPAINLILSPEALACIIANLFTGFYILYKLRINNTV